MFDMTKVRPHNYEGFINARKKPVVLQALQVNLPEGFSVETLEGKMSGNPGDWLIIGVNGERYPCKDEIFRKTYDIGV